MLAVVEHDEGLARRQELQHRLGGIVTGLVARPTALINTPGTRRGSLTGASSATSPIRELAELFSRELVGKARLARPSRPDHAQEPCGREELVPECQLLATAEEAEELDGEVVGYLLQGPKGREVGFEVRR